MMPPRSSKLFYGYLVVAACFVVLFLVWGTYPGSRCWFSFLVGWVVKQLVVHFGGGQVYQRLKPVFFGIIAGELVATGLAISVELTYYWTTGESSGLQFSVLAQ